MKTTTFGMMLAVVVAVGSASADDWPAFRGPAGSGVSTEKTAPTTWGPDQNIKWKASLPQPCNGSPIVSNGRVFVTCAEDPKGQKRSLYCFDRKNGKPLWVRTVEFAKEDRTHDTNPYCGTTPAADGKVVVVWHSSAGLHCYDFEGKELWKRDLGEFNHMWGAGTSPVLHDGRVILNTGPGKTRVFVTALSLATGKTIWEADEPFKGNGDNNESKKPMGSWSTPLVTQVDGKDQILCVMPTRVVSYAPQDGRVLWSCQGLRFEKGDLSYSSPVVSGDTVVVIGGYNGPGLGIRLGGAGDITASHRLWRNTDNPQSIGSGVAIDGYIYQPFAGANLLTCIEPKTGKAVWRDRAKDGAFWGSVISAAGRLYATDQQGRTVVFKPNPEKFELIAANELGEASNSTPAVSNGEIFIRTSKRLYCIAE